MSAVSASVDNIVGVAMCYEELAHLQMSNLLEKSEPSLHKTSKSKKWRIPDGLFTCDRVRR